MSISVSVVSRRGFSLCLRLISYIVINRLFSVSGTALSYVREEDNLYRLLRYIKHQFCMVMSCTNKEITWIIINMLVRYLRMTKSRLLFFFFACLFAFIENGTSHVNGNAY